MSAPALVETENVVVAIENVVETENVVVAIGNVVVETEKASVGESLKGSESEIEASNEERRTQEREVERQASAGEDRINENEQKSEPTESKEHSPSQINLESGKDHQNDPLSMQQSLIDSVDLSQQSLNPSTGVITNQSNPQEQDKSVKQACPPLTESRFNLIMQHKVLNRIRRPVPLHRIDLNTPPKQRWQEIVRQYLPFLPPVINAIKLGEQEELGPFAGFVKFFASGFSYYMTPLFMKEEMESIAEVTSTVGLDFRRILTLNLGYDFLAHCTSIVTRDKLGLPVHLRNMDWDIDAFRDITIDVEFVKDGVVIYRTTTWVGYVGIMTGMRYPDPEGKGGYSLSLNYRKANQSMSYNVLSGMTNAWPVGLLYRSILNKVQFYKQAAERLKTDILMAPCYITICGAAPGEGAIIVRRRRSVKTILCPDEHKPYALITNIDPTMTNVDRNWARDDELLINSAQRRTVAERKLQQVGDIENEIQAFDILDQFPVFNSQTIYSCMMCPAAKIYQADVIHITQ